MLILQANVSLCIATHVMNFHVFFRFIYSDICISDYVARHMNNVLKQLSAVTHTINI